jgi:diphthine synthase
MLYLIGLGLGFKDLPVRSLENIKKCSEVYLENYTCIPGFDLKPFEKLIGKKVQLLNRTQVEVDKPFFQKAKSKKIALLVNGDVLSATTHTEIIQQAKKQKIPLEIIHGPSVLTAVSDTGLSLYKFGKTASIPFWQDNFKPESFFDLLEQNQKIGAHTLFLLDLNPPKFMKIQEAIDLLLKVAKKRKSRLFTQKTFCIACSQLGTPKQIIRRGSAKELINKRFGTPACLIVPGKIAEYEEEI